MDKKVLTTQDLYKKNPVAPILAIGGIFIAAFVYSWLSNGFNKGSVSLLVIMLLCLVPMVMLGNVQKNKIINGDFVIYLDYVVDKRKRETGTSGNRKIRHELFFHKLSGNKRDLTSSFSTNIKTYRDANIGDWFYIVKIESGSLSKTQLFPLNKYDLSIDLQSKLKK